jgi:sulfite reductase beta subunit-like hemoprotein
MAGNDNDNDKPRREESKAEAAKRDSRQLRGTIAQALASDATHFNEDDALLLKFHGIYQCVNRDNWSARRDAGQEAEYFYMVRVAIPGGVLTAEQYLALDRIADECANGSLRITTRQGIQFHAVYKPRLAATLAGIGRHLMTTLAACGDVERNVITCPAPLADEPHRVVRELAGRIARELRPATRAYREIWLGGEKAVSAGETEPFYGEQYLPRKFKTGVALATDNSVDVYSDDCGLIALVEDGHVSGFNVLVGGGQGMTHNRADTFVALAQPIAFVGVEHAVEAVRTVAAIFRDHGNRADRKHARLKYLIAEWGLPRFCEEFRRRVSFPVAPPVTLPRPEIHD